ncbi:MAG: hypothetical protein DWQ37_06565 [Planctomycetota bacterium]|nr:MAG: hypothetical protein DWQ37_06565 [Planctomycetota bacterium]
MKRDSDQRRWVKITVIVVAVVVAIEAPFVLLAFLSVIPYWAGWISGPDGVTTVIRYWDGTTVMEHRPDVPAWGIAMICVAVAGNMLIWSAVGYGTWRWWRRRSQ